MRLNLPKWTFFYQRLVPPGLYIGDNTLNEFV